MVLNPKPKFAILANFGSLLNLVLPNLDRSRRQLSKNTKIVKFEQNLVPKFLISQILRVLGSQKSSAAAGNAKRDRPLRQEGKGGILLLFLPEIRRIRAAKAQSFDQGGVGRPGTQRAQRG